MTMHLSWQDFNKIFSSLIVLMKKIYIYKDDYTYISTTILQPLFSRVGKT